MVSLVTSSLTIYLSLGERPVKIPVLTATAPVEVLAPFSYPFLFKETSVIIIKVGVVKILSDSLLERDFV